MFLGGASSLCEQLQQAPYVALCILWCKADDPSVWFLKIPNFGHALQFGAAVASMVVIETSDGNSCCLLLRRGFKLKQTSTAVPWETFMFRSRWGFAALKQLIFLLFGDTGGVGGGGWGFTLLPDWSVKCSTPERTELRAAVIRLCQNANTGRGRSFSWNADVLVLSDNRLHEFRK